MSRTIRFAGAPCTLEEIKGTLWLLRYYRRFLASGMEMCLNPENPYARYDGDGLTRDQARRRLAWLVNVAINRKAGIPDVQGRKEGSDYQASLYRDCQRVRDRVNRRVIVRQFETTEINQRFAHLLDERGIA